MKRRGNKSHKVPNVKLRPAAEGAVSRLRREESSIYAEDSQIGSDDTAIVDLCLRPFKGMVICATGVQDKPTLFKQAVELGAFCVSAFTDRVTHLVADGHGGAKYQCAVERKIPILQPSFVSESYQIWLRGDDVDIESGISSHRLPIFSAITLCISGSLPLHLRSEISSLLAQHGGSYAKAMERPIRVTHLLCVGDEETEKMRYAEKFNKTGEANVKLVWEEWFWDCIEFGGRFDEATYAVSRPRPVPKKKGVEPPPPSSEPGQEELEPSSSMDTDDGGDAAGPSKTTQKSKTKPKPAEPDTNLPEEEPATVNRLPATTLHLWGNLLGRRGYEVADGVLVRSPTKSKATSVPLDDNDDGMGMGEKGSVIAQFRRANSFAPTKAAAAVEGDTKGKERIQPFRRTKTIAAVPGSSSKATSFMSAVPGNSKPGESSSSTTTKDKEKPKPNANLFKGLKFIALGEAKGPVVRKAVEEHGGRILLTGGSGGEEVEEEVDYVIVRLVSGSKLYRDELSPVLRSKYRTECWLERCIFAERVCSPEEHVTFTPIGVGVPIEGAERLVVSWSGLDESEICWTGRLLRGLGITAAKGFSRKSTHLLCPSGSGAKFEKAIEWAIPVISMDWLGYMVRTGKVPGGNEFIVGGPAEVAADVRTPKRRKDTGKGKEREVDVKGMMTRQNTDISESFGDSCREEPESVSSEMVIDDQTPRTPSHPRTQSAPFGRPTGLLGGVNPNPLVANTDADENTTPTRSMSTPVIRTTPSRGSQGKRLNGSRSARRSQRLTNREVEQERTQVRIPSSTSPSPMKINPPRPGLRSGLSSPVKQLHVAAQGSSPVIPQEVTKALHDNIASLLGKRKVLVEGEEDTEAEGGRGGRGGGRKGKRARPRPRANLQGTSRNISAAASLASLPSMNFDEITNPFNAIPIDDQEDMENVKNAIDDSLRVTYEDPGQREEKLKLMKLLKVTEPGTGIPLAGTGQIGMESGGGPGEVGKRRSSRVAGR